MIASKSSPSDPDAGNDESEGYSKASSSSSPRPHLQRHAAAISPLHAGTSPSSQSPASLVLASHDGSVGSTEPDWDQSAPPARPVNVKSEEVEGSDLMDNDAAAQAKLQRMQELKEAVAAHAPTGHQIPKSVPPPSRTSSGPGILRKIAAILEEDTGSMSATLADSFSSPLESRASPESGKSTESANTIKGSSVPPTPNQNALRTPSYPFPYIPGTPRTWHSSFHRPFTTLSPTVSSSDGKEAIERLGDRPMSDVSTPTPSFGSFLPSNFERRNSDGEDDQFDPPNLYDLVLQLNLEPGIDPWWTAAAQIMHEFYGAERMSLALPADAGELENVPWGQKATCNISGSPTVNLNLQRPVGHETTKEQEQTKPTQAPLRSVFDSPGPATSSRVTGPTSRPRLASRHSYAGYERDRPDSAQWPSHTQSTIRGGTLRPHAPSRTVSHMLAMNMDSEIESTTVEPPASVVSFFSPDRPSANETTLSDTDFSSIAADMHHDPYIHVLPVLRALNYEQHALLETSSVNRVIERGKLVALTRDYSSEASSSSRSFSTPHSEAKFTESGNVKGTTKPKLPKDYFSRWIASPAAYEDYEQLPASPWSQSPAPSPAIQADPEANPFFSSTNVDEGCFNPTGSSQDYGQYGQVEAIGVDSASTIIHIPLIHPRLSHSLPLHGGRSFRMRASIGSAAEIPMFDNDAGQASQRRDRSPLKKSPIAILSFLSPTVPYPHSLIKSLQLLAPHLATSFENAHQYSGTYRQSDMFHRRRSSGTWTRQGFGVDQSLEDLIEADIDASNDSISITSPSDYSGRSRQSPGGSVLGTPSWDPSCIGFSREHGIATTATATTPGQHSTGDMMDSYFDAKRRTNHASSANSPGVGQARGLESPTAESDRPGIRYEGPNAFNDIDIRPDLHEHRRLGSEDKGSAARRSAPKTGAASTRQERSSRSSRPHSLLHSYGADFSSTFQTLPATTTTPLKPPGRPTDKTSADEAQDMPPPSERLLRTIIDSLPVQIFTAAPGSGALTWVNSKFIVYRGQDPMTIIRDPWDAIHPEDRSHYMEEWQRSLSTGQQFSHKVRLRRFDHAFRWFFVRATPLKDKKQKIVHWTGTYMDIHEQHVAEVNASRQLETAASEAKYRALANSSPQIVFAVSRSRGVIFCNTQWVIFSGQTEALATGLGFMDYVHPDDLAKCRLPSLDADGSPILDVPTSVPFDSASPGTSGRSSDDSSDAGKTITSPGTVTSPDSLTPPTDQMPQAKLYKLASTGILKVARDLDGRPSYSTEVRLRSKDGQYRWHLVRVLLAETIHKDESEEEIWYGTCTDINDHKLLEQTLKDTMDAKSRFLSNMSHEIRTPLNGITGMVNFLMDSSLTTEQMEHVNIIRNSTEGLRDLINDILDLSKVEAGMINLTMEWMHIRSLIEEVNDIMFALAVDKGLELNYVVDEDVPSMVKGDRFRLRQVLLNVVGNAIKFTQKGEVFVRCKALGAVESSLPDDEKMLQFQVIDTGTGFTEKEAEFLFKRFSQIDSTNAKQHSGSGLGLAISMQLVELQGGHMKASSVPGKGSMFTFTIKFGLPSADDRPPLSTTSSAESVAIPSTDGVPVIPTEQLPGIETTQAMAPLQSQVRFSSKDLESPTSYASSPKTVQSVASSGSSDPSLRTATSSIRSGSSHSSFMSEITNAKSTAMPLELPSQPRASGSLSSPDTRNTSSSGSIQTVRPSQSGLTPRSRSPFQPPMFSILVVCSLVHSREALVQHIEMTIPKSSPHHITARENFQGCKTLFNGEEPVIFSHVVLDLHEIPDVVEFINQILKSPAYSGTSIIVITDHVQRREISRQAPQHDFDRLGTDGRLSFVFKPLKPSKLAIVFDPQKEREMSTDRNQDSAQAVAVNQKQVFEDLRKRLGNRGIRVLLVEDNKTSQMVLLKFLSKVSIAVESVFDGVQCTEKVFSQPAGYYSLILCDLHMPYKDGFQTCKEIRRWERHEKYFHLPIIALSANVLGDVYSKCVEAGFNSYVTKPVDFKELSNAMTKFLDPADPTKPHEFMRPSPE